MPTFGQRLKGKVKSYYDTYYSVIEKYGEVKKGAKLNDAKFHDELVSFDQNGNFSHSVEYNSDGTIYCNYKGKYEYLENNIIESIYLSFDPETTIQRKPFILESARYSWGEICKMTYKINLSGQPIEETIYDLMDREIYKITFKRDDEGKTLEENFSDGSAEQYKYDDKGNRIEKISRSAGGSTTITSFKYDESGNVLEMSTNNFFKSTYKFHYEHSTFIYRFDNQGNWIERTEYDHDIPERIVVRTIEYSL